MPMFKFAKVAAPRQRLVRKFAFQSSNSMATTFQFSAEYEPPETLNEQLEQEKTRVMGQLRHGAPQDLEELHLIVRERWHQILASKVRRIDNLTARKLSALMSMDPAALATGADDLIPMDPEDTTPISDEDRTKGEIPPEIKTAADLAKLNIFYLVNACGEFRLVLETVIKDVSRFQDKDWEQQGKNSQPGADTSSVVA